MSIGLLTNRKFLVFDFFGSVSLFVFFVIMFSNLASTPHSPNEFVWAIELGTGAFAYLFMFLFFITNTVIFIYIGNFLGLELKMVRHLAGYTINIIGSLTGTICTIFLANFNSPPYIWLLLSLVPLLFLIRKQRNFLILSGIFIFFIFLVVFWHTVEKNVTWSPYYEIIITPFSTKGNTTDSYLVIVDKLHHQAIRDLSFDDKSNKVNSEKKKVYELPYQFSKPKSVLVFGAGTGNDVAAALRQGAERVVAVEIDPKIAEIGKELHPEKPYSSEKVGLEVTDARSYIKNTQEKFDLITFGYLDSHRILSQMSSVRLESHVYTTENFKIVRHRLSNRGIVAVTFAVNEKWIADRIVAILRENFGEPIIIYQSSRYGFGTLFLAGPGLKDIVINETLPIHYFISPISPTWVPQQNISGFIDSKEFTSNLVPTDDWPFLYLKEKSVPENYLFSILIVIIIAVVLVKKYCPIVAISKEGMFFFLLGFSFMLIETKTITFLSLLINSTWIISSLTISAILIMILFSNLLVSKYKNINLNIVYILLILSLGIQYFITPNDLLSFGLFEGAVFGLLISALPILFSGIIFANSITISKNNLSHNLSYNLIGAVVGGMAEYSVMIFGIKALTILTLVSYLASFLLRKR